MGLNKLRARMDPLSSRVQDNVSSAFGPTADAVAKTPIMGTRPVWTPFPFVPAFANVGGLFATAAYYKDALFRVQAKGVLTCAAGCGANTVIGTFPMGLRPAQTQRKAVEGNGAAAQFLSISPVGVVTNEVAIGAGGSVDFDFSFLAEQ